MKKQAFLNNINNTYKQCKIEFISYVEKDKLS